MSTINQVLHHIQKTPRGKPFAVTVMLKYGTRAAVDKSLSRLTAEGKIVRVTRGIYVRPEHSRYVGQVLPGTRQIAEIIAKKTKAIVQVSGAEAARQFGLTMQVPMQHIYLTTGQSRIIKMHNIEVKLKRVSPRKLLFPESRAGVAIMALWFLGKNLVNANTIKVIKNKLTIDEFNKLTSATEYMPAWMNNAIIHYKKENELV